MRNRPSRTSTSAHALLRSLHQDSWRAADLAALIGQFLPLYMTVADLEHRYTALWNEEIPLSRLLQPWGSDLAQAAETCAQALGAAVMPAPTQETESLCDTLLAWAHDDALTAFIAVTMGAYWPEPALRAALREALWHQPDLYNGAAQFCWKPGGPEGDARRELWQGIMAIGPAAGRVARAARSLRQSWYDSLMPLSAPSAPVSRPAEIRVLFS